MIKIEAVTLEAAYQDAASKLECSVTELKIEVVQTPTKGILGLFRKPAIIVAVREVNTSNTDNKIEDLDKREVFKQETSVNLHNKEQKASPNKKETQVKKEEKKSESKQQEQKKHLKKSKKKSHAPKERREETQRILNDTIMPTSFVSMQDDEDEYDVSNYLADYDEDEEAIDSQSVSEIAVIVQKEINELFDLTCFNIDVIDVNVYDENTLLVEFKGEDAALLIGKEGYRYKALSYMIFNWLNTKYQVQLRLEIAEFLKNQEESISKYLVGVCENINRDGRAQTKILDGVLIQIALNELRDKYPDKYIVIRSTRDGLKYIIINDYHAN